MVINSDDVSSYVQEESQQNPFYWPLQPEHSFNRELGWMVISS